MDWIGLQNILAYTNKVIMEEIEILANILKALSDPTRLKLIRLLGECNQGICTGGALCVNALARQLNVTQSAVSQHLRILKAAGLVQGTRNGSFMHYALNPEGIGTYKEMIRNILGVEFV
jgi:ArsR family transcriptional regulator, arsenate/arsenite/antimonite-responsive transcriptional repressor